LAPTNSRQNRAAIFSSNTRPRSRGAGTTGGRGGCERGWIRARRRADGSDPAERKTDRGSSSDGHQQRRAPGGRPSRSIWQGPSRQQADPIRAQERAAEARRAGDADADLGAEQTHGRPIAGEARRSSPSARKRRWRRPDAAAGGRGGRWRRLREEERSNLLL
jgi:hypothetical protein